MTEVVVCELFLLDPAVGFRGGEAGAVRLVPLALDELKTGCREDCEVADVDVGGWGARTGAEVSDKVGLGRAYSVVHSRAVLSCCLRWRVNCCATDGTVAFTLS